MKETERSIIKFLSEAVLTPEQDLSKIILKPVADGKAPDRELELKDYTMAHQLCLIGLAIQGQDTLEKEMATHSAAAPLLC